MLSEIPHAYDFSFLIAESKDVFIYSVKFMAGGDEMVYESIISLPIVDSEHTRMAEKDIQIVQGEEMLTILSQCCDYRLPIQIRMLSKEMNCTGRIQKVDAQGQNLEVMCLGDTEAEPLLLPGALVEVAFLRDGLACLFKACCLGFGRNPDCRSIAMPDFMEVFQRRQHFRVNPPTMREIDSLAHYLDSNEMRMVETLNVSAGGILLFDPFLIAAPEFDHPLKVRLQFKDELNLAVKGTVRHAAVHPGRKTGFCIGIRFNKLSRSEEDRVIKILMRWQRELQRKRLDA